MNQQHRDILTAIGRKQPITTAGIAEYLLDHFGYGGGMEFDAFRDQVSKTIGYLKSKGEIVGEDIPQSKGKPLRYWALANPQSDCQSAEMASDVAEVEAVTEECSATVQENLTVDADMVATLDALDTERERQERQAVAETPESFTDTWSTTLTTHFKSAHKPHLAISDIMDAYHQEVAEDTDQNFYSFCLGVAYAEKHHGISQ